MQENSGFFFGFFARREAKSVKTSVFNIFRDTLHKVRIKYKKTAFVSIQHGVSQKVWENSFSRFSWRLVQTSHKTQENSVFRAFCTTFSEKCEKTVFHVFRESMKTAFFLFFSFLFELSVRCSSKWVEKQCFHTFYMTHWTWFAWNARKQRLLSYLHDVPQKEWKTSIFHVFRDALYKVRTLVNSVLWASCRTFAKNVWK